MATEILASDILPPRTVSSRGMKGMLDRLETDSPGQYIFKLVPHRALEDSLFRVHPNPSQVTAPTSQNNRIPPTPIPSPAGRERSRVRAQDWSWLPSSARNSPSGLAFLYTKTPEFTYIPQLAIAPPFPIVHETETTDRETLLQCVDPPLHVAIILIRYGYVAIAIAHDETLVLTKTETRFVPNKHRAGGQSANRFKRSREKWAREFFDKSARLAEERFGAYQHRIDWLIFGGDRHVINGFLERAKLPDGLDGRILGRRLNTLRPNRNALKDAVRQAWSSTIYELAERPKPEITLPSLKSA
ncbi:MAG: Vms1/Ankzf1 family peptidyl-tRNA hydrolase [Chloroflexi bacterium]|nr:Vms1/Ankzf1 family peptidyl-tRNA hydrolase [Chloroflexota bacterium]